MKSKANIKGHPLHPILIGFPIAFYTGTLVFDILQHLFKIGTGHTAYYLNIAAIGSAFLAAIPGIVDYIYTVPPASSAKKRATVHAITNSTVLLLFIIALLYRINADDISVYLLLGIEFIAEILLLFAGWMGGTLVYRNQIGIDIRYANAGKWKEEYLTGKNGQVEVTDIDQLKINQMRLIHVGEHRIVLARTEKGLTAFDDRCSHKGASLAGGTLICGTVQCPWHGTQFDVHTGRVKAGPAKEAVTIHRHQEVNGKIYITLPAKK